jgi:type I site-specific restriction-modification system R (restriction) subunit
LRLDSPNLSPEPSASEIIDYYKVFRNMRKALKDYAQGQTQEATKDMGIDEIA